MIETCSWRFPLGTESLCDSRYLPYQFDCLDRRFATDVTNYGSTAQVLTPVWFGDRVCG